MEPYFAVVFLMAHIPEGLLLNKSCFEKDNEQDGSLSLKTCCHPFEEINNECKCPYGKRYIPDIKDCDPCPVDLYGLNCSQKCKCKDNESCDPVDGCKGSLTASVGTDTSEIVIYMSCIAVLGLGIILGIAACRNKEWVMKRTNLLRTRFLLLLLDRSEHIEKSCPDDTNDTNLYDDIDEKAMI